MRGGALPLLAWAGVISLAMAGNWIVTGDAIQVGTFAVAVGIVLLAAAALRVRSPQALQRGAPGRDAAPEAHPEASLASVGLALGLAAALFGLVWAKFIVYFGVGLAAFSAGRLWLELRSARLSRRAVTGEDR